MDGATWWQNLIVILGALGGFEFIKWLFNRKKEKQLGLIEVKEREFELDEKRIEELHASLNKAIGLNDKLLEKLTTENAVLDKHIDRNRELSDRLYNAEQEVNRVNDLLTEEQNKTADLERRLGVSMRLVDHYKEWRCERSDCQDPKGRRPPNQKLKNKTYSMPSDVQTENKTTQNK